MRFLHAISLAIAAVCLDIVPSLVTMGQPQPVYQAGFMPGYQHRKRKYTRR